MKVKSVYIEITNQCNLNCRTCYNRSGLNRQRQELSIDQIQEIIDIFQTQYGCERFLFSGGEPTLHSEFGALLDLIDSHPDLHFGITTNGTTENEDLLKLLARREDFDLQVSLDGSCEEQNARTRGAGNFEKALSFIRRIHQSSGQKPRLKMVISQQNMDDVAAFYALALELNCTPEFAFIYRSGNGMDNWEEKALPDEQKSRLSRQIEQLNRQFGVEAVLPLCTFGCSFIGSLNALSLCIKVDGSIQPCQSLYNAAYTVGNALAFHATEFESGMERIAFIAQERKKQDYGCERCLLNGHCSKGYMAAAVLLHDDPLADDGDCLLRKISALKTIRG